SHHRHDRSDAVRLAQSLQGHPQLSHVRGASGENDSSEKTREGGGRHGRAMNIPDELKWENAPFRGQPGTFQHSLVYVLGDCLRAIKSYRDQTRPKTVHCNVQLVLVGCAFFESAMSRGLVNAAQFRLRTLTRTPEHATTRDELELCVKRLFDG